MAKLTRERENLHRFEDEDYTFLRKPKKDKDTHKEDDEEKLLNSMKALFNLCSVRKGYELLDYKLLGRSEHIINYNNQHNKSSKPLAPFNISTPYLFFHLHNSNYNH